ncbi:hypothetical protein LO763_00685 [Glycomyces sp. A-F 0318]|uniref:hypothetical protein n=1 Tax=Glycomyces amatae TaxID=2881355 RepID=UPI001E5C9250|nr:hypothetical protein [Glycomyces amatae]MCD0442141.1 hypothetical protein [Glycomyces amatae]
MAEGYMRWVVTTDPEQLADLAAKANELDTFGLAEYAVSLGLRPPGHTEGQRPSIEFATPPGHEGPPLLMWSGYFPSIPPEDLYEDDTGEEDDEADPWAALGVETGPPGDGESPTAAGSGSP